MYGEENKHFRPKLNRHIRGSYGWCASSSELIEINACSIYRLDYYYFFFNERLSY